MNPSSTALDELERRIRSLAGASTADLIGIAPGSAFSAQELGDLGRSFGPVQSIIVLAMHIVDPILEVRFYAAGTYQESRVAAKFGDALLRDACWRVVEILRDGGWRAAIARNQRYGADDPRHRISYKRAALLAGFGAIGRSTLLIHPEWGPWITLRTVITDAPLAPDSPLDFSPCDGCGRCIEACPVGALSEDGFDRTACEGLYHSALAGRITPLSPGNCEECMRACPVGTAPPHLRIGAQRP